MQTLVKETVTLHKVLSRYLSAAVVEVRMRHCCYLSSLLVFLGYPAVELWDWRPSATLSFPPRIFFDLQV